MSGKLVHFAPGLPGIPEELLLARDRGEVLFITGSGTSRPAPTNLPDFRGLVQGIYDELDPVVGAAFRRALEYQSRGRDPVRRLQKDPKYFGDLDAQQSAELYRSLLGDFDIALGMLERRMDGSSGNQSKVRKSAQRIIAAGSKPNGLHRAIRVLGRRFDEPFIATTNFDPMLEAVTPRLNAEKIFGLTSLPRPSRRSEFHGIFHIHGALSSKQASTSEMILTDQDFGDYYLRRRTTADFIYDAARIFHLVLVGYSLSDAPMRYLLNAIAGDESHFTDIKQRYAFIPVTGVDERAEADWRGRGITPIPYNSANNHQQLCDVLEAWVRFVPRTGNTEHTRKHLTKIAKKAPSDVTSDELSVFRYLFRRSNPEEQRHIIHSLSTSKASFHWLPVIVDIMQEPQ